MQSPFYCLIQRSRDKMGSMGKTEELYYKSAYLKEFDAVVTACEAIDEEGKGRYSIILDKTAFFPEQGGQSCDNGWLFMPDGQKALVSYVSIDDDKIIRHICDTMIPIGTSVHGIIDFAHRFSNMQQHTGEHIFSGIVHSEFGYDNVGFHLSDTEVTMDYNGVITAKDIDRIELLVNRAIWANLPVKCEIVPPEKLSDYQYRSKKELTGDVRIVTIENVDACACCAPHVERTGEIGFLKVVGLQNYKGGVRVNILCGERALKYIEKEHEILRDLSGKLTTSSENVTDSVLKTLKDNSELKAELAACRQKLISYEINEIDPSLCDVFLIREEMDSNVMRNTVNMLAKKHSGLCGIFAGDSDKGYRYVISSGADKKDATILSNMLRSNYSAKGGGNAAMVQGSIITSDIDKVIEDLKQFI